MEKYDSSRKKHQRREGESSEALLDKERIVTALNIQPGQTVLDAGCGGGYMSRAFSHQVTRYGKVYALDRDASCIGLTRKETEGTNIEAIEGDITRPTQIDPCSVDLIYVSTVVHGFSKQEVQDFLAEVKRLLKPNAVLAIVEIEKKKTPFGPPLNMRLSPEELKRVIPMAPLNTIQVGEHFYMQMFRNTESADHNDE